MEYKVSILKEGSVYEYLSVMSSMNKRTAKEYVSRLNSFRVFILNYYGRYMTLDKITTKIKEGSENPYSILNNYAAFLLSSNNISSSTLKQRVTTIKNFFEYHDVDISPRKFNIKIELPKVIRKKKDSSIKLLTSYWFNIFESIKLINRYWSRIFNISNFLP